MPSETATSAWAIPPVSSFSMISIYPRGLMAGYAHGTAGTQAVCQKSLSRARYCTASAM